jgi:acetyl esterase/lipase
MDSFKEIPLADGATAIRTIRERGDEWGVQTGRLGAVGFSAGGRLAIDLALQSDVAVRPAFVGAIYPATPSDLNPYGAPPLFLATAADDPIFDLAIRAHTAWREHGRSTEAHFYDRGGHGFGMLKLGLPVDGWIEQFHNWMNLSGVGA